MPTVRKWGGENKLDSKVTTPKTFHWAASLYSCKCKLPLVSGTKQSASYLKIQTSCIILTFSLQINCYLKYFLLPSQVQFPNFFLNYILCAIKLQSAAGSFSYFPKYSTEVQLHHHLQLCHFLNILYSRTLTKSYQNEVKVWIHGCLKKVFLLRI